MQIDSDLLDFAIKTKLEEPIFRLYGWSPACISIGRNQDDKFLDKDLLKTHNIDIVRRITGGRALLHKDEITYCYICPVSSLKNGESVIESYKQISQFLIDGFKKLDILLEFPQDKRANTKFNYCMSISTGADLSFEGKKLIGSAQCRKEGYILQHGSINFSYDEILLEKIFGEKPDNNCLACLKEINSNITFQNVIDALDVSFVDKNLII